MRNEQIVAEFLKPPSEGGAYTDEKLAALLAHAEDGKLAYFSCCCLAGIPSAAHALKGANAFEAGTKPHWDALQSQGGIEASNAYGRIAATDGLRRAKLIPLIHAELSGRELLRAQVEVSEVVMV